LPPSRRFQVDFSLTCRYYNSKNKPLMSSFKKRAPAAGSSNTAPPPGTRVSAYNSSVLLSTGVASVDDVLGGGCPIGSILLVEEDQDTSYAKLLLKYWIAQGLCCTNQQIILASSGLDQTPEEIISKLPWSDDAPVASTSGSYASNSTHNNNAGGATTDDEDDNMTGSSSSSKASMKIAFRYENLKKFETSVRSTTSSLGNTADPVYCSVFDLTKTLELGDEARSRLKCFDMEEMYEDGEYIVLDEIKKQLAKSSGDQ
jgi:elongator complex protein 4